MRMFFFFFVFLLSAEATFDQSISGRLFLHGSFFVESRMLRELALEEQRFTDSYQWKILLRSLTFSHIPAQVNKNASKEKAV